MASTTRPLRPKTTGLVIAASVGPTMVNFGTTSVSTFRRWTRPLVSATLNIFAASVILAQAPHSITYQSTSTPAAPAFAQLGTGTIFGSRVFGLADNLTTVSINLNGALLAAIGIGGGNLLISGRVTEGASFASPRLQVSRFLEIHRATSQRVVLETAPIGDVPVPAALPLFASGLAMIAFYRTPAQTPGSRICVTHTVLLQRKRPPRGGLFVGGNECMSRRAEIIPLADLDAVVAQDRVGRRQVEIEVRHRGREQISLARELHIVWPPILQVDLAVGRSCRSAPASAS